MKNYRELIVWKKSRCLLSAVYKVTQLFPKGESYGLKSKIQNSCIEILSNITKGFSGKNRNELICFLKYSMGSASKLDNYFKRAHDLRLLNNPEYMHLTKEINEIMCMLVSLIQKPNAVC